jgi:hypothetical protein
MSRKKVTVIRDELKIKGGGLYAFLPFDNLDKNHNAVFKIGLALNLNKRVEQYHTYFPQGVYMIAFLEDPPIPLTLRHKKGPTRKEHYIKIEKFILKFIDNNGGKRIHTTARVINPNVERKGETEWEYTNDDIIHKAFEAAKKKFGGTLNLYKLRKLQIDDTSTEKTYIGKIKFK